MSLFSLNSKPGAHLTSALMRSLLLLLLLLTASAVVMALRLPSVPLVTADPLFQFHLPAGSSQSVFWDGSPRPLLASVRWSNKICHSLLGPGNHLCPTLLPLNFSVTSLSTELFFATPDSFTLQLRLSTPLFPGNLMTAPLAVISALCDPAPCQFFFGVSGISSVSDPTDAVVADSPISGQLRIGPASQRPLTPVGDAVGASWGYLYLRPVNATSVAGNYSDVLTSFAASGTLPSPGEVSFGPISANASGIPSIFSMFLAPQARFDLVFGWDSSPAALDFFGKPLAASWQDTFSNFSEVLEAQVANLEETLSDCLKFDAVAAAAASAGSGGNQQFVELATVAYRQAMAAITHVSRRTNFAFVKEISSDGDVSTVDVIFPMSPVLLFWDPALLQRLLLPLFAFANNETANHYDKPWAPHHLGIWPVCNATSDNQEDMPVEESGNMILMVAALMKLMPKETQTNIVKPYGKLLAGWAEYLKNALPDPGDQLCTDDFTGPAPHNVNLAAKGIIALAAYAEIILSPLSDPLAGYYAKIAAAYADFWGIYAWQGNHTLLEYSDEGTWSMKYNLYFQELLGLDVFPNVFQAERDYYLNFQFNEFGIPLDVRNNFGKSDWEMFSFAGADQSQFDRVVDALWRFYNVSTSLVPLTDWYFTSSPTSAGFRARPVVGAFWARPLLQKMRKVFHH